MSRRESGAGEGTPLSSPASTTAVVVVTLKVVKHSCGIAKQLRGETQERFLRRITHVHLEGRALSSLVCDPPDLLSRVCPAVSTLYAHENSLRELPQSLDAPNLTHLYLQSNQIQQLRGLSGLLNLKKLYLEYNCISLVEGLEKLLHLEELHLSHQQLPPGKEMTFDSPTLQSLSASLRVLTCACNNMTTLYPLSKLVTLDASSNCIEDIKQVKGVLSECGDLRELNLKGNPLCHGRSYREEIVITSRLTVLDEKDVLPQERTFLLRKAGAATKHQHEARRAASQGGGFSGGSGGDANNGDDSPHEFASSAALDLPPVPHGATVAPAPRPLKVRPPHSQAMRQKPSCPMELHVRRL
eukprot:TRINITY_DN5099_c0_g1_i1.p1 TRINITY_DN5099_c0_g1~~TRINITY_DN5099_c0_g1_i1.p1  ORF type:complete len:356 (+),score=68.76 TRINITY_DN5099_c0_g1_i1:46-1113(+)